jgi:four helix bundle protein
MLPIQNHRDLDAWNVAMETAVACYSLAAQLPPTERYGIGSQLRRAVVSIPTNIAEGHGSGRDGILVRHLGIALGSAAEVDTLLELSVRTNLLRKQDVAPVQVQLGRARQLAFGLRRRVRLRIVKKATNVSGVVLLCLWLSRILAH